MRTEQADSFSDLFFVFLLSNFEGCHMQSSEMKQYRNETSVGAICSYRVQGV